MRGAAAAMLDAERALDEIQRQFPSYPTLRGTRRRFVPRVEAVEREDHYFVRAELPGVESADLDIAVAEGFGAEESTVDVKASADEPAADAEATNDDADDGAVTTANEVDSFERRIRFNGEIDEAAVKARYRNGLLSITIPKQKAPEPVIRSIPVQVA
mgnify:CR=1 FL=1